VCVYYISGIQGGFLWNTCNKYTHEVTYSVCVCVERERERERERGKREGGGGGMGRGGRGGGWVGGGGGLVNHTSLFAIYNFENEPFRVFVQ
jgi:hypothetical protein